MGVNPLLSSVLLVIDPRPGGLLVRSNSSSYSATVFSEVLMTVM